MATVTIADDQGNVMLVIGIDNTETGESGLPQGGLCYDGKSLDRGAAWCAKAGLTQVHFTKQVLDSLRQVRALELEDEESNDLVLDHDEGHCQKLGDHEQRIMQLEAHLPKQDDVPSNVTPIRETEATVPSHVPACHQSADQNTEGKHRLWHDPAEGCQRPDEHPNWRE